MPSLHITLCLISIWASGALSIPTHHTENLEDSLPEDVQQRISAFLHSLQGDELKAEGDQASISLEKGDKILVFFECGPGQAQCENGGHGPAISYRPNLHPICTCLCPASFNSPRCQFPSEQIEIVTS